jgi:hypothetical protein
MTYSWCRISFCLSLILIATGFDQPLTEERLNTAASARGGTGTSACVAHLSAPRESAKQ